MLISHTAHEDEVGLGIDEGCTEKVLRCTDRATGLDLTSGGSRCSGAHHEH
jgi:hypothetical protein